MNELDYFVRAEVKTNETSCGTFKHLRYVFKCADCGSEYERHNLTNVSCYCSDCMKRRSEERKKEIEANHLRKAKKAVCQDIKKIVHNISKENAVIDFMGAKYINKKVVVDAINDYFREDPE